MVVCVCVCVTVGHTYSQPAAVSILDAALEHCRHIAYLHGDAFTWMQLKRALTNRQVVNLQTGRWRTDTLFHHGCHIYVYSVCVCVSSLVQAVHDLSNEEQGLLPLHARVSGVLKSSLDHFSGFLIHCKDKSTCALKHHRVVICGDLIWQMSRREYFPLSKTFRTGWKQVLFSI